MHTCVLLTDCIIIGGLLRLGEGEDMRTARPESLGTGLGPLIIDGEATPTIKTLSRIQHRLFQTNHYKVE